jgi:hypothetical protein
MWGSTQLLGNAPRWCTLGLYPATSFFFLNGEVNEALGWETKKNIVGRFMQDLNLNLFIFSLNYFIIA